jgi:hypothetical protein
VACREGGRLPRDPPQLPAHFLRLFNVRIWLQQFHPVPSGRRKIPAPIAVTRKPSTARREPVLAWRPWASSPTAISAAAIISGRGRRKQRKEAVYRESPEAMKPAQ